MSESEIDKAVYARLDEEGVRRMKAVEYTIEFLKDKNVTKFEAFNDVFERIYKSLQNDTTKQ